MPKHLLKLGWHLEVSGQGIPACCSSHLSKSMLLETIATCLKGHPFVLEICQNITYFRGTPESPYSWYTFLGVLRAPRLKARVSRRRFGMKKAVA